MKISNWLGTLLCAIVLAAPAGAVKLKIADIKLSFEDASSSWKVKAKTCNKTSGDSETVFYEIRLFPIAEPIDPETKSWKIGTWTDSALHAGDCQTEDLPITVDVSRVPADTYHVVLWAGDGSGHGKKRYVSDHNYIKQ